ncbi:MAG: Dph6-related ATP pyrophosphatase [Planctomycetota bacterium]
MGREKVIVSWSTGKDSAASVYEVIASAEYEIAALLTTATREYDRVSMHGVRRCLVERQAQSMGIALEQVSISKDDTEQDYANAMREVLQEHRRKGVSGVVFGDIHLAQLRKRREKNLSMVGMRGIFPLWKRDTMTLAHQLIKAGFKAVVTCVDTNALSEKFAGRVFGRRFLDDLPAGVDCCGENGEFHCFVYDGPIFHEPICFRRGKMVLREKRFLYCDLIPDRD